MEKELIGKYSLVALRLNALLSDLTTNLTLNAKGTSKNPLSESDAEIFTDTRRQKRSVAGLREHFGNAVAVEKIKSETEWVFFRGAPKV